MTLTEIPRDIPADGINKVDLQHNQITVIPAGIFPNPNTWVELNMDYNLLSSIEPQGFLGLARLNILSLSNNQLTEIKAGMFDHLISLQKFYPQNNMIGHIEVGALNIRPLLFLNLENNLLVNLTADMLDGLPALRGLHVQYNRLETLASDIFGTREALTLALSDPWAVNPEADNPWVCDERLCWMKEWERIERISHYKNYRYFYDDRKFSHPRCANHVDWETWECGQTKPSADITNTGRFCK